MTNYPPYANCDFNSRGLWDCHLVLCSVILHLNPGKIVLCISKSLARCENILKRHKCERTSVKVTFDKSQKFPSKTSDAANVTFTT